jgi:hypothetical protein
LSAWTLRFRIFSGSPFLARGVVRFTQLGGYVLFVERPGSCCSFSIGDVGSGIPFSGWSMNISLYPVAGGPPVPVGTWRGATESYAAAGHQGQTAMYVTIGCPGVRQTMTRPLQRLTRS